MRYIARLLATALVPYTMYAVAYLFESRVPVKDVPLWRGQSKAFMPGDIGLAAFIAAPGTFEYPPTRRQRILGLLIGVVAIVAVRRFTYSPKDYTMNQWKSPSKVYHDVVVCLLLGYLGATRCIDFYTHRQDSSGTQRQLMGVTGLGVWIGCAVWDELHDEVPNALQHPDTWQPIWRPSPSPLL